MVNLAYYTTVTAHNNRNSDIRGSNVKNLNKS